MTFVNPFLLFRFWVLTTGLIFFMFAGNLSLFAQDSLAMTGKRIGVYFGSKEFQYPQSYYLPIAQFLSVSDNRSYTGKMKNELLIRLGEQLAEQLPGISGADSVYFINGDLTRGRAFINSYDVRANRIYDPARAFDGTDYILVLNSLDLSTRIENDVFIRSNRMLTERVHVKQGNMKLTLFDLGDLKTPPRVIETCLDERKSPEKSISFDFYRKRSALGRFFGRMFTANWNQLRTGSDSNCGK